jgi:small subunit ribosomal protein S5
MRFKSIARETRISEGSELETTVVKINRCATVVKGGRRFSFSALVVVGNRNGIVGYGFGKANEVPPAVEKAEKDARKHLFHVSLLGDTIPHEVWGRFGSARVFLFPAAPGTGVIAGAAVRGVVDLVGIKNILTKSFGSCNPVNLVKATLQGLTQLRSLEEVEILRGVPLREAAPAAPGGAPAAPAAQGS